MSSLILVPQWIFSEIEKISFEFLWNGKDRIKRKTMYQDYVYGGLRMINFKVFVKTQRIMWLKRLLYGERKTGWKMYFDYCFAPVGGKLIFLCDYETSKLSLKSPPFYLEVVKAWQDMTKCRNPDGDTINPILFNNKNVCINGKIIFIKALYDVGVYHVNHILDNGQLKPLAYFQNLGIKGDGLLQIIDIYNALPRSGRGAIAQSAFQQVDL